MRYDEFVAAGRVRRRSLDATNKGSGSLPLANVGGCSLLTMTNLMPLCSHSTSRWKRWTYHTFTPSLRMAWSHPTVAECAASRLSNVVNVESYQ